VVAKAPSGEILFSNRYAERVVGRPLSEIADDFPMSHLDGRPYEFAERPVPRSLASGEEILAEEFFGPGPDGSHVLYRCSSWPVYSEDGVIVAAVCVTRDVTEQSRQEERLTYLAGLLDNTEDAVVAMDERYFISGWNEGAERLYGWKASEVVGKSANEVARTNLSDAERAALRRQLVETGRWRGEVEVLRKDGTTADAELISVALRGQLGGITGYLTIHRDISERKRTEETLRKSQRRSETILESITDAFVAVDSEWRYTYVNELALRRMSWRSDRPLTHEDVLGRGMWELFPDAVGTMLEHKCREAMRERREVRFETFFEPSGEWIEARLYPTDGGLSIYYQDVTGRKRVEEERQNRVRQQELRLDEAREAERQRIARALHDEAVQDLTDAVAQAGRGRKAGLDAEAAEQLVSALEGVSRQLRGAIYDLRLNEREDRPLMERLEALVDVHRSLAGDADVEVDITGATAAAWLGDRATEVLRIVGEALTNARRHSGARHIRVSADASEQTLRLEVTDDGHGFDLAGGPTGGGVGLVGMRERAALLRADLHIRSEPGGGTAVQFELRAGAHDEQRADAVRILLVEDHPRVREAIAEIFAAEPDLDLVAQAGSLAEARGMLRDIDVAVVDLGLPDGSGAALIEELRDANPRAKVVVLSASVDPADTAWARESGAAASVFKPHAVHKLVDVIRRLRG
jgi:PAS domain S-box-containing protein